MTMGDCYNGPIHSGTSFLGELTKVERQDDTEHSTNIEILFLDSAQKNPYKF